MGAQAFNPYLPEWEYVPDGEPHVFGDRVYVYGSHDRFGAPIFCVENYVCWSAPVDDLTDWRFEGTIFRKNQDPKNKLGLRLLFAPDVVQGADGRYYLYYAFDFMGTIGVAACDEPAGHYEFLAHVCWPDGTRYGRSGHDGFGFDPGVLVDDDGRVYLYSGFRTHIPAIVTGCKRTFNDGGYMVELEPDMHTIRGEERLLFPIDDTSVLPAGHTFFEASSIRKFDDRYVFVYSSEVNHELCYATSDRPDGGFTYGGVLVSIGDVGLPGHADEAHATNYLGNTHGGMLRVPDAEAPGGWAYYIFYHRQTNRCSYARQACAERLRVTEDGRFLQAEVTSCGLNGGPLAGTGTYPARIACNLWSAEGAGRVDGDGVRKRLADHPYLTQEGKGTEGRQYVANLRRGSVVGFKYFDLTATTRMSFTVRGTAQGGFVIASDEQLQNVLGTIVLPSTKGEWKTFETELDIAGCYGEAIYLQYVGTGAHDLLEFSLS